MSDQQVGAEGPAAGRGELVSRREYARRRGWAPSYVVKLCQQQVITIVAPCTTCGEAVTSREAKCPGCGSSTVEVDWSARGRIDPELADREVDANRDPEKEYTRERWEQRRAANTVATRRGEAPPDASDGHPPYSGSPSQSAQAPSVSPPGDLLADIQADAPGPGSGGATPAPAVAPSPYQAAKAESEMYRAKSAELDYRERVGELVQVVQVRAGAYAAARQVRDRMLAIPDRLAAVLANERDTARVHQLLADEIRTVLDDLSTRGGLALVA